MSLLGKLNTSEGGHIKEMGEAAHAAIQEVHERLDQAGGPVIADLEKFKDKIVQGMRAGFEKYDDTLNALARRVSALEPFLPEIEAFSARRIADLEHAAVIYPDHSAAAVGSVPFVAPQPVTQTAPTADANHRVVPRGT